MKCFENTLGAVAALVVYLLLCRTEAKISNATGDIFCRQAFFLVDKAVGLLPAAKPVYSFGARSEEGIFNNLNFLVKCYRELLFGDNLPYNSQRSNMHAHLSDAGSKKWNEGIRFSLIPRINKKFPDGNCKIVSIGGSFSATDSRHFAQHAKCKEVHEFEPLPTFYREMMKVVEGYKNLIPHNYGLGGVDIDIPFDESKSQGVATFIDAAHGREAGGTSGSPVGEETTMLHIVSPTTALKVPRLSLWLYYSTCVYLTV